MTKNDSERVSPLSGLLGRSVLRRAAGARSFERGEDYFASGQAGSPAEHRGAITAKVRGTRPYQVKLWAAHKPKRNFMKLLDGGKWE